MEFTVCKETTYVFDFMKWLGEQAPQYAMAIAAGFGLYWAWDTWIRDRENHRAQPQKELVQMAYLALEKPLAASAGEQGTFDVAKGLVKLNYRVADVRRAITVALVLRSVDFYKAEKWWANAENFLPGYIPNDHPDKSRYPA